MKYALPTVFCLALSTLAHPDEVKLANGNSLTGIAREEPGRVVVETRLGTLTVPADSVKSIVRGRTVVHEYQERLAGLPHPPQAPQVFELALWAQEEGLVRYVNTLLQWTIALDPDHEQARTLLGFVRHEGRWMARQERDALRSRTQSAPAEQARASRQGTVRRTRPQPEISPGYVYFGIPPSPPPRGSQRHDYGGGFLVTWPIVRVPMAR